MISTIIPSAAISARCDLCENESENIVIGPGTEDMKYFCNKHFYNYYFFSLTITAAPGVVVNVTAVAASVCIVEIAMAVTAFYQNPM
jgi:hypothetical protein